MLGEKFRSLFRPGGPPPANGSGVHGAVRPSPSLAYHSNGHNGDRSSNGLRQFFENVRGSRLQILDLGAACQSNVNFITSQGHKLFSADLLVCMERLGAAARDPASRPSLCETFLRETLDFPDEHFDGILVWDTLEFLEEEVLAAVVAKLQGIVKPSGTLLTFFHTQSKGQTVPIYRYQIQGRDTLRLHLRFVRPLPRSFNNRHLERLFSPFRSVKFFLAKDGLREVVVTR